MRVLLAIDFSKGSETVLDTVLARPWPKNTEFLVLHVLDTGSYAQFTAVVENAKRQATTLVEAAAEKLTKAGHKASSEVAIGTPRTAIAELAKERQANLVILGSHGHGAIGRFLLGSVAQAILRSVPCSVEIVRPAVSRPEAATHGMKILLATDGSEFSMAAAKSVAVRPWPANSQVKILSVQEIPAFENQTAAYPLAAIYPANLLEELLKNAHNHAREAVESAKQIFADTDLQLTNTCSTPLGDPRNTILEQAQDWGADLIILGSHGRRGLDRMLIGSVSEAVAVHAKCSAEVIHPDRPRGSGKTT